MSYSTLPPQPKVAKTEIIAPLVEFIIPPNLWGHKKTKLKNMFSKLTDDDLNYVVGQESQLLGRLTARLHKSEAELQELITRL